MSQQLLLVEDEARLARAMSALLTDEGYDVRACTGVADAVEAFAPRRFVAAILDVDVADGLVYPIADLLAQAGIPYAFCSSTHPDNVPARHQDALFLEKPFDLDQLRELATALAARARESGN